MSVTEESAGATAIRRFTIPEVPEAELRRCAPASGPRAGPTPSSSRIIRRARSWRSCRNSPATGRQNTTGAGARRN